MTLASTEELNRRFGIAGVAAISEENGGLRRVRVRSGAVSGEVYLHGAHVTSWIPNSTEVLFMSGQSRYQPGKAIRGGVPICFPWFGANVNNPEAPAHGFARIREWTLQSIENGAVDVTVRLALDSDDETRELWPGDFRAVYCVTFGKELRLELQVENTGSSSFSFEEALHTYYAVSNVTAIKLAGLNSIEYLDKTDSNKKKTQSGDLVVDSETDRVFLDTSGPVAIEDTLLRRRILVEKQHSRSTVIWNPWKQKAHAMSDFGDDEWQRMICVEAANVGSSAISLEPGEQHLISTATRVENP
jgi:glucose-6-phosphate 1-epimerase